MMLPRGDLGSCDAPECAQPVVLLVCHPTTVVVDGVVEAAEGRTVGWCAAHRDGKRGAMCLNDLPRDEIDAEKRAIARASMAAQPKGR